MIIVDWPCESSYRGAKISLNYDGLVELIIEKLQPKLLVDIDMSADDITMRAGGMPMGWVDFQEI